MSGVTVAPQPSKNDNDAFLASCNANPGTSLDARFDMESLLQSQGWPMEDLTSEVHDLMLRESMNWLPWMDDTNHSVKTGSPMESLDSQLLAQTLQLDGLFGQELNFDPLTQVESSLLYDEFTFDPSPASIPVPSQNQQPYEQQQQHHHHHHHHNHVLPVTNEHSSAPTTQVLPPSCEDKMLDTITTEDQEDSSTDDDNDADDDSEEEDDSDDDEQQKGPISVLTSTYMYLPKRQIEEVLLDKITHQLQPDKLSGILSIVSSSVSDDGDDDYQSNVEEVEIDLSSLVREKLVRVMLYVDACIAEQQQGGPVVNLDHYLVGDKIATKEKKRTVSTDVTSKAANDGPISMAALTKKSRPSSRKQTAVAKISGQPKRRRIRRKPDQGMVSTRPTRRRSALHKRRMLEDMLLVLSDNDDEDEDGLDQQVMVTYGEEQMDFKVVENQTIVHQPHIVSSPSPASGNDGEFCIETNDDVDEDDEEIDIM